MTFLAMFLMDRLHVFKDKGRGQSWRLLISSMPLFGALLVALSRTCDYHHHWQDVFVGSLLGIGIGVLSYRLYFPVKQLRTSDRSVSDTDLLQILELASETLKHSQLNNNTNEETVGEESKLMALSNIKWI